MHHSKTYSNAVVTVNAGERQLLVHKLAHTHESANDKIARSISITYLED